MIWRLVDGKAGHMRQSAALVAAIRSLPNQPSMAVEDIDLTVKPGLLSLVAKARARSPLVAIGAGHQTHAALVALKYLGGAKTVVLMRPSFPLRLFDLCVIPEHDGVRERPGVVNTFGPLAPKPERVERDPGKILFLIGGPSDHFDFEPHAIEAAIRIVSTAHPEARVTLSDSRRTPKDFLVDVRKNFPYVRLVPWQSCSADWLPNMLGSCHSAWITEDSLSMLFEGLTAGCAVGLIGQPRKTSSRVTAAVDRLQTEGWVRTLQNPVYPSREPLDEAHRIARWMSRNQFI